MDWKKLEAAAEPKRFAESIKDLPVMRHQGHSPDGSTEVTRQAEHNGHHIVIRTTYRIEVDGRTRAIGLTVDNDGQVYCHALPNGLFDSAIDMVERIIDAYPEEFAPGRANEPQREEHPGHNHMGIPPHEH